MEREILQRLRARLSQAPEGELWIGDDAAAVRLPEGLVLLATDALVAGVHADMNLVSEADFGWKAVAVNVSDIAAMGGRPLHALCCLAAPPETDVEAVLEGLLEAAGVYGTALVGGDLTNSATLMATVTLTGTTDGRAAVTRSGARPGDAVFVTGPLGASAAGLEALRAGKEQPALARAHRRPRALPAEGRAAALGGASSMIDISDGLAVDLAHLAGESGVGVELDWVPVADGATEAQALGGGEDYELAFSAPDPERLLESFAASGLEAPAQIGRCTAAPAAVWLRGARLEGLGWEHRWQQRKPKATSPAQ